MHNRVWVIRAAAAGLWAGAALAQAAPDVPPAPVSATTEQPASKPPARTDFPPIWLSLLDPPQSIYPETMPPRPAESMNSGGVNFGLDVNWFTDYMYRGINQTTQGLRSENALQFEAFAKFNLGKLPHPFIGLFVNVFNSDPVSRFEEVRPYFGFDWDLKPIIVTVGFNSYIHPNRKNLDTQEAYASITLDDSRIFRTPAPLLSPYIYGAYDCDLYNGFYLEAGLKHDFVFEDIGLTLTPRGDVAYVIDHPLYSKPGAAGRDYGLQHFDAGLVATVSLNHMFSVDHRFGEWSLKGYMYYSAGIDRHLKADTLIWGGAGLEFRY